jgi:hypothetical protein
MPNPVQSNAIVENTAALKNSPTGDLKGASRDFFNHVMHLFNDYVEPNKDWTHRIYVPSHEKSGSAAVTIILNQEMNDWQNFEEFMASLYGNLYSMEKEVGRLMGGG